MHAHIEHIPCSFAEHAWMQTKNATKHHKTWNRLMHRQAKTVSQEGVGRCIWWYLMYHCHMQVCQCASHTGKPTPPKHPEHAYHADTFLAGIGVTQQMDASQPSRYLVLLWLQGLRRVVRCKCYRISLAARPGRSWRKASSRDLRIAFYIGSSSPATCVKNMFESTQEATHAKSWNIMKIKWR
jgi:hypothetical protein